MSAGLLFSFPHAVAVFFRYFITGRKINNLCWVGKDKGWRVSVTGRKSYCTSGGKGFPPVKYVIQGKPMDERVKDSFNPNWLVHEKLSHRNSLKKNY